MVEITNASKTFSPGTEDEKKALCGINLTINNGDFITVIGANGAGKSTLFNLICGTFPIDSGRITVDGVDYTFMPEHKRSMQIGRLFQDPMWGTAPNMTIGENLALAGGHGGWLSHVTKAEKAEFADKIKELGMGLESRMNSPVGLLSGGQRQALTLIMATINPPKLLLLDEHTAALDPATAEKVMSLTKRIVEENHLTCMMITHNMQSALEFGNRTLMMNGGRVIFDTSGEERAKLTVNDLLLKFKEESGKALDNDRMLLS